jgi:hypothetical protein
LLACAYTARIDSIVPALIVAGEAATGGGLAGAQPAMAASTIKPNKAGIDRNVRVSVACRTVAGFGVSAEHVLSWPI